MVPYIQCTLPLYCIIGNTFPMYYNAQTSTVSLVRSSVRPKAVSWSLETGFTVKNLVQESLPFSYIVREMNTAAIG